MFVLLKPAREKEGKHLGNEKDRLIELGRTSDWKYDNKFSLQP